NDVWPSSVNVDWIDSTNGPVSEDAIAPIFVNTLRSPEANGATYLFVINSERLGPGQGEKYDLAQSQSEDWWLTMDGFSAHYVYRLGFDGPTHLVSLADRGEEKVLPLN